MDIKGLIKSNEELEVIDNGVWFDDFDEAPGMRLLVVGLTSEAAQKALEIKQAQQRLKNKGKPVTDNQLTKITREVLAEVILKDWDGLKNDGEPVPYSKELATEWLTSRAGDKFTGLVLYAAQQVDARANEFIEKSQKNS